MKKNHILFAGLIVLMALLLCAAASAAPLSREQVEARLAAGGTAPATVMSVLILNVLGPEVASVIWISPV